MLFPLMQVIDFLTGAGIAFAIAIAVGVGVGVGVITGATCENLTRIVGDEKVKLSACNLMKPFFSLTKVVAT